MRRRCVTLDDPCVAIPTSDVVQTTLQIFTVWEWRPEAAKHWQWSGRHCQALAVEWTPRGQKQQLPAEGRLSDSMYQSTFAHCLGTNNVYNFLFNT